jgi:hypothetical protein
VRTNRTIGMSQVQFGELLRRVEGLVTWDKGAGRPRGLTLAQGLKATLMYFKNNITEEVIAELLFVSQSVISETISTLEGVIVEALKDFEPDLAEAAEGLAGRVAVIDGSLHPCWSWKDKKDLWSGKRIAPRRRPVVYPTQSGGIGGIFLGLMPNLAPKGQGNNSMAENQCSCPGVWSEALADPRDTVKAELLDTLISSGESPAPTGKTPETGAIPLRRRLVLADATSGGWSDI